MEAKLEPHMDAVPQLTEQTREDLKKLFDEMVAAFARDHRANHRYDDGAECSLHILLMEWHNQCSPGEGRDIFYGFWMNWLSLEQFSRIPAYDPDESIREGLQNYRDFVNLPPHAHSRIMMQLYRLAHFFAGIVLNKGEFHTLRC